jgi:hypothetical protein
MSVLLIPFHPEHFRQIPVPDHDAGILVMPNLDRRLEQAVVPDQSFTATEDGKVVGVGGVVPFWDGVGEAWAIYPRDTRRYRFAIYRITKQMINLIERRYNYRRIEAKAHCGWMAAVSFLIAMGFEIEGRARAYGPDGADYYHMARVR